MSIRNHKECLLLNADWSPLTIVSWQRAIVWFFRNKNQINFGVEIIDFYKDDYINGINNKKYPIPCIAKTKRYFKPIKQTLTFSRKNIFIRDSNTCQYCGKSFSINNLTYDHVIPKSQWNYDKGSPTSWTNIVTACIDCNRKKGNKTPKQINMPLISLPVKPQKTQKYLPISQHLFKIKDQIPSEWFTYLPESYA